MLARNLIFILFIMAPLIGSAQDVSSGLSIISNPPGAEALLRGDITLSGLTPVNFDSRLAGRYKVKIQKYGYETYKSKIFLRPDRPITLTVTLKAKTRSKAALRSIFIPGWGQKYYGNSSRGTVFFTLAAGTAIWALFTNDDYNDKLDHYIDINNEYRTEIKIEQRQILYQELQLARKDAYDAENKRYITAGIFAAVWGLSLLDALVFFPNEKGDISINSISLEPDLKQGGAQITLSHRF